MTIWILTIVLMASLAGLGYRQGVVRVAFSLLGILFGALLAVPLGHLIKPLVAMIVKNPVLLWLLPTFVMFCVVLTIFKIVGLAMHRKVDVYYKYRAGELRYALWERLGHRGGLCLGLANGLAYLVLLSFVIYSLSYWTVQISGAESGSMIVNLLNRMGRDLESTGMARVARSVDGMPPAYYDAADVAGTIYHNYTPRLAARLSSYPAFLGVGERPEFQGLAADGEFIGLWTKQGSLSDLLNNPGFKGVLKSPDAMKTLWAAAKPNLQDLQNFLKTGESATYTERILGRWNFDVAGALAVLRRTKPNISPTQLLQQRNWMTANLGKASFIATPQQEAFLKNLPSFKPSAPGVPLQLQNGQGNWKGADSKYEVTVNLESGAETSPVEFHGDRLIVTIKNFGYVFSREN